MYNEEKSSKFTRLNFEIFLWLLYGVIVILNIYGVLVEKEAVKTDNNDLEIKSSRIIEVALVIAFFVYIGFLIRNYLGYVEAPEDEKNIHIVRIWGTIFFVAAAICLIYFQVKRTEILENE